MYSPISNVFIPLHPDSRFYTAVPELRLVGHTDVHLRMEFALVIAVVPGLGHCSFKIVLGHYS